MGGVATVRINGTEITAPPGSAIEYEVTETGPTLDRNAKGTGAELSASGSEVKLSDFNASAPESQLAGRQGGGAKGGATEFDLKIIGAIGVHPLMAVGIACLLGAGVCGYFGIRRGMFIAGAMGVSMIALSLYPSFALVAVIGIAALVAYIWAERSGLLKGEALRAVVAGVEDLPDSERKAAKARIKNHADDRDVKTIRTVKMKDGLLSER